MKKIIRKIVSLTLVAALATSSASALSAESVLELLDAYYLDDIPAASRELGTAEEILASLGDPYTIYMPAPQYESFLTGVDGGSVTGIGVMIHQVQDKGVEIISVLPNSPALELGLKAGDCILAVDGKAVASLEDAKEMIAGESGTKIELTVLLETGAVSTYAMVRRDVPIPIVTYELIEGVPYLNCASFGDSTADTVREALESYINWETPFILDLQQNPGGLDTSVAKTAGWFLGGVTVCYYLNSQEQVSRLYTFPNTPDFTDQPLIVLTSSHSASGSEMFAGAVRAYQGGIVIGDRTYGKGVAQVVLDEDSLPAMFDGDSVKITTSRFYAADGGTNDVVGIIPTLSIATGYVKQVALLLSSPKPDAPDGFLKLDLGGSTFYVNVEQAMDEKNLPAFQELLESLDITQLASLGLDGEWINLGGEAIASYLGVPYESRNFVDVGSSSYINQLSALATHGIITGDADGKFNPTEVMTRGAFVQMVGEALQLRIVEGNPFQDVAEDHPYQKAIAAAYARGLIQGDDKGLFRPDDGITHQEAVAILANAVQWLNLDARQNQYLGFTDTQMAGYSGYPSWARDCAAVLDSIGALMQDSTPDIVQKDEAGAMIYELLEASNLLWND